MSRRRKTPVQIDVVEPAACSVDVRRAILQKVPFLNGLSASDIDVVNEQFREFGFEPGESIYFSGETAVNLYVVAAGQVKLLRHSVSGQDVLLDVLQPGDYFGNLSTLADDVYPDTAQAHTAVCVLSISSEAFRTLLSQYPSVALSVLDITTRRLRDTQKIVQQLSTDSAEQRLAAVLLKLADKLGEVTSDGILIQMPLSRDDLAQMTVTTTETASRIISQFQKEGVVHGGRQWIAITNKAKLEAIAGTEDPA